MDEVKESDKAYLDNLLDEVLEDFNKPEEVKVEPVSNNAQQTQTPEWTEDVIQEATKNFEETMRKLLQESKKSDGEPSKSGTGRTEMESLMAEFVNLAEASAKAAVNPENSKEKEAGLAATIKDMNESCMELKGAPSPEDVASMFNNLGLSGSEEDEQGSAGLFTLMQNMMESILSKNIIYPPVKELAEKFPDWLADNKSKLSDVDYVKHNKQYSLLKKVAETYETEQESDSKEKKQKNFDQVIQLMQDLQQIGPPPTEICGNVAGTTDVSTILSSLGMAQDQITPSENCSIM